MRVYLIAPAPDFGSRVLNDDCAIGVAKPFAMSAAAGIATVAAHFPEEFEIRLCDEIVEPVDFTDPADIVGISVNVAQAPRAVDLAAAFRGDGRIVVLGGAHVSLAPDLFQDVADCLVIGEFETIAAEFMADLAAGRLKPRYCGGKADLAASRRPRWDLYPNDRALAGVVQTSRGCPFECNFCDVIQYLGRIQRHKPPSLVIEEVQALYDLGYRQINLSDDNFTVYRQRARDLLLALAAWNGQDGRQPVRFLTQMSIDVARDPDMLSLCNRAGLRFAFLGLETNNVEALKESRKRQNLHGDLAAQCRRIVAMGITIQAGLIVGFDSDDLGCFERQLAFVQSLPVIVFRLSVLVAPVATPLYDEMKANGRIVDDPAASLAQSGSSMTNIRPLQMTREQLAEGAEWLRSAILDPDNAILRFESYAHTVGDVPDHLADYGPRGPAGRSGPFVELVSLMSKDKAVRKVIECVADLSRQRPNIRPDLMQALGLYLNSYARQPERALARGANGAPTNRLGAGPARRNAAAPTMGGLK